jgi:NADPH:quinone reductase-like Zn-dependent oxidoreductase
VALTYCESLGLRITVSRSETPPFSEGQRVAFFPAKGAWGEYVVVRYKSLLAVPNEISDQIAAQMLIHKYDHRIRTHQSRS